MSTFFRRLLFFCFLFASFFSFSGCYSVDSLKERMPKGDGLVLAPAEGHVLKIISDIKAQSPEPLEICVLDKHCSFSELSPYIKDGSTMVIIFMKVYHKHITISPISGQIRQVYYVPGSFRNVFRKDAYKENEHNSILIDGDIPVAVVQIAGLVARRIICDVTAGDAVQRGDRLGHIKIGSAVAVLLPPECKLNVREGQKVEAAKDIIATYKLLETR